MAHRTLATSAGGPLEAMNPHVRRTGSHVEFGRLRPEGNGEDQGGGGGTNTRTRHGREPGGTDTDDEI